MVNKLHIAMEPEQNILKFYQMNMVQSLKCSCCNNLIQIDCPFLDLPLLVHSAFSSRKIEHLEMALREFLKEETMEDDNACYCDNCNTKTKTKTRYYFKHLPKILTFQLKRVNVDGDRMRYQKIHDSVTLPLSIEFNKSQENCNEWILKATRGKENNVQNTHCPESTDRDRSFAPTQAMQAGDAVDGEGRKVEVVQDQSDQDSSEEKEKKYELFAIWHHVGGFCGGHYYAEIKSVEDGNWYCFNDRTVEQRGKDISLRSKTAYLIMYRMIERNSVSAAAEGSGKNFTTVWKFLSEIFARVTNNLRSRTTSPQERDDEPGVFRVEMSCGHAVDPISLTEWCRCLIDQGHLEFHCPASTHGTNGKCNKEWSYPEVRTCALLSLEERQVFEEKLTLLSAGKYCEYKQCPRCDSCVERKDLTNLAVDCSICMANDDSPFEFCWQCLLEWEGPAPRSDRCDNIHCTNVHLQVLENCGRKNLSASNVQSCPKVRACPTCGMIIEHKDMCKYMVCIRCHVEFCFACLQTEAICSKSSTHSTNCSRPVAPRQTRIPVWNQTVKKNVNKIANRTPNFHPHNIPDHNLNVPAPPPQNYIPRRNLEQNLNPSLNSNRQCNCCTIL
ncbi:uncharacterized protein LOC129703753 isoform X4 [Leucoraja erinacea]|nr:uncharacterized protein LOC129703753 isoform X4 [Leucoraja erinacea]